MKMAKGFKTGGRQPGSGDYQRFRAVRLPTEIDRKMVELVEQDRKLSISQFMRLAIEDKIRAEQ